MACDANILVRNVKMLWDLRLHNPFWLIPVLSSLFTSIPDQDHPQLKLNLILCPNVSGKPNKHIVNVPVTRRSPQTDLVNMAMAALTAPKYQGDCRQLLLEASSTFLQMANNARLNDTNADHKVFYSHLAFNCARMQDVLEGSTPLDDGVAVRLLEHFGSLISKEDLREIPYTYSTTARLRTLNFHWNQVRDLCNTERLDFIGRWLHQSTSAEELGALDRALEDCVDGISKRQPIQRSKAFEGQPTVKSLGEPKSIVQRAAQSSFDALHRCRQCKCPCPHDFGVKLELGTYRQPPTSSRPRVRQYRYKDRTAGGLDFEVFLCMEGDWHEVGIHAVRSLVQFSLPEEKTLVHRKEAVSARTKIEILCDEIARMKSKPGQRLELELAEDHLFHMGFEKTSFHIDNPAEDVSLMQCINDHQERFTERTKRLLYIIIGYMVFHLHNTSWLQAEWSSENIKFFRTISSEVPLRPFIDARLDDIIDDDQNKQEIEDAFYHPCPVLVSLAVVLLEIYFVKPFTELAAEHDIHLIEDPRGRVAATDLELVYYGAEEVGCRSQIPEDAKGILQAIDSCIDGELWEDHDGNILDRRTLKSRIYHSIVEPLEAHLSHGFSDIPLESIDKHARSIDFAHRGKFITCRKPEEVSRSMLTAARAVSHTSVPHTRSQAIQQGACLTELDYSSKPPRPSSVANPIPNLNLKPSSIVGSGSANFFDDQIGDQKGSDIPYPTHAAPALLSVMLPRINIY